MNKHWLNHAFQAVRQQFFSRWDRAGRWRLRQVRDLDGAQGKCCRGDRTIRITHLPKGDEGTVLLIHEIAHAVANGGHGTRWQVRLEEAAAIAEATGRMELAVLLRKEITGYNDPMARVSAGMLYQEIGDAVAGTPEATFVQVIDYLRRDYGLSRKEFLNRFRRARMFFDREKRDEEEQARTRAKFMAAREEAAQIQAGEMKHGKRLLSHPAQRARNPEQ